MVTITKHYCGLIVDTCINLVPKAYVNAVLLVDEETGHIVERSELAPWVQAVVDEVSERAFSEYITGGANPNEIYI